MIITDTGIFPGTLKPGDILIQENGNINACNGCMKCWDTTPGVCAYQDTLQKMADLLSSFVQKVLERTLPCYTPEYEIRNGHMFHKRRFSNHVNVSVYFYGNDIDPLEKKSAEDMVKRFVMKMQGRLQRILFVSDAMQIGGLA